MTLDLTILAVVASFAALGYATGAIQQLSHWIGIAAAYLCAKPLAALAAPAVAAGMGWPAPLTAVGLRAAAMPVILIAAVLASRIVLNAVLPGDQRNKPDRVAGLFLGGGKAALVAWVVLGVTLAFEKPLGRNFPAAEAALSASSAAAFTRTHSLFAPTASAEMTAP